MKPSRRPRSLPSALARRAFSVPFAWLLALLLLAVAPAFVPLAAVADLLLGRRFATVRFFVFVLVLAWAEAVGSIVALAIGADAERNYALQRRWTQVLAQAAFRCWSITFAVEGGADLATGPFLLLSRHTTLADTLLPMLLAALPHGLRPRYVLKQELRWDPCLDIVGGRVPNVFVDREIGEVARSLEGEARQAALAVAEHQREALHDLAEGADAGSFVAIYPEGTRFSPTRRARLLARLEGEDREHVERLTHVLPARPGGFLALLDGAPEADVVIVAHAGMEGSARLPDLFAGTVIGARWQVRATRYPRAKLPTDRAGRIAWLNDRWGEVDAWVAARVGG